MKKSKIKQIVAVIAICSLCATGLVYSQEAPATYLDRARAVAGQKIKCPQCGAENDATASSCVNCGYPLRPQQAVPARQPQAPPEMMVPPEIMVPPEEMARFERGLGAAGIPGAPGAIPTPTEEKPPIKMITVLEGEHIFCAKCGKELQKPERKQVPETEISGYFDDGTHGDEVANDGIYSNIIEKRNVLCERCYWQKEAINRLIEKASGDNPVEFYMIYVASLEKGSEIPSYEYWRARKDEFLEEYKSRVLASYKDENGNFYPKYTPPRPTLETLALQLQSQIQSASMAAQQWLSRRGSSGVHTPSAMQPTPGEGGVPEQWRSSYFGERHPFGP